LDIKNCFHTAKVEKQLLWGKDTQNIKMHYFLITARTGNWKKRTSFVFCFKKVIFICKNSFFPRNNQTNHQGMGKKQQMSHKLLRFSKIMSIFAT